MVVISFQILIPYAPVKRELFLEWLVRDLFQFLNTNFLMYNFNSVGMIWYIFVGEKYSPIISWCVLCLFQVAPPAWRAASGP